MIIVTGGAGFIGSNIVKSLNRDGLKDIIIVDDLTDGSKMRNLSDLDFVDYYDIDEFILCINNKFNFGNIEAVIHQGACSSTTEWDGKYVMRNNFTFSKMIYDFCLLNNSQFIYASSASVYGMGHNGFSENRRCEKPINMYAFSKFQFDQYIRSVIEKSPIQIVGLRYFNVYGPRESHKETMASTIFHFNEQIKKHNVAKLFCGYDGYDNGFQERDFVYVKDCAQVNLWFLNNKNKSGIFNLGSGTSRTFNDVADCVIKWHGKGRIEYIDFPQHLKNSYQSYTKSDNTKLVQAGYSNEFFTIEKGIEDYLNWLNG